MNSYERIQDLLLEACFVSEQEGRAKGRRRLAVTATLLGALTAGLHGTGKPSIPSAVKPSVSVAKSSERSTPPRLPSSRTVATTTSEPASDSGDTNIEQKPKPKRRAKARNKPPVETAAERNARYLQLQKSIDQEQGRIDFDKRQQRRVWDRPIKDRK